MKKTSWKKIAAACGVCLFLFTMSSQAGPASFKFGVELATFDSLGSEEGAIANGYGSLNWANFYSLDGVNYGEPSGYEAGVISSNNVAFNAYGYPAAIYSDNYAFMLKSAYLTAAWNDNLHVQVKGYFLGRLVYTRTYILSATTPTLVKFPSALVSEVDFIASGGTPYYDGDATHFAMDNLSYTVLPIFIKPFTLKLPVPVGD